MTITQNTVSLILCFPNVFFSFILNTLSYFIFKDFFLEYLFFTKSHEKTTLFAATSVAKTTELNSPFCLLWMSQCI